MAYLKTKNAKENVNLYYETYGQGKPVVLIHGWPLSLRMWDSQLASYPEEGLQVIAYDRRGFGKSEKSSSGYNYDVFADDLHEFLEELNLTDVTLVGFSMGGGEVARYLGKYGTERVSKAVFVSSVTPFLLKTPNNPDGVDKEVFEEITAGLKKDRAHFLAGFSKKFYAVGIITSPVSDELLSSDLTVAMESSLKATLDAAAAFAETDFRDDLRKINIPVLVIHGEKDVTVPMQASGLRMQDFVPQTELLVYQNEAHGLVITAKERFDEDLLDFIKK